MKSVWNYVFIYFLSDIVFHVLGGGGDGCTLNLVTKHHDHWTLHHVRTADKSHIKNDNNNFWTMCVTHEAKMNGHRFHANE